MMKAIVTKYIGPTNFKGARIKIKAEGLPAVIVGWDDRYNVSKNHTQAAKLFAEKYRWHGDWVGGGMPDQTGNCYVRVPGGLLDPAQSQTDDTFHVWREEDK